VEVITAKGKLAASVVEEERRVDIRQIEFLDCSLCSVSAGDDQREGALLFSEEAEGVGLVAAIGGVSEAEQVADALAPGALHYQLGNAVSGSHKPYNQEKKARNEGKRVHCQSLAQQKFESASKKQ
jgi:hypothetical protein